MTTFTITLPERKKLIAWCAMLVVGVLLLSALVAGISFLRTLLLGKPVINDPYAALLEEIAQMQVQLREKEQKLSELGVLYEAMVSDQEGEPEQLAQLEGDLNKANEELMILREALKMAETEKNEALRQSEGAQSTLDLVMTKYVKRFVVQVKVVKDCYLWTEDTGIRFNCYVTEDEYAGIQNGDVLPICPDLDVPSTGNYQIVVVNKYIAELSDV